MGRHRDLQELAHLLVEEAYPELRGSELDVRRGRTSFFGTVSWTSLPGTIRIVCSTQTKKWHEAALLGLLSHELSHTAQSKHSTSERSTDIDVIDRGLGPYLAAERATTGKYEDYIISRGRDRYLGYRTIRGHLLGLELTQLDVLLREMRLVPSRKAECELLNHDVSIRHSDGRTEISINGNTFMVISDAKDPKIELIAREGITCVYVDGREIGSYSNSTT